MRAKPDQRAGEMTGEGDSPRRRLPSVDRVLSSPEARDAIARFGREGFKKAVVDHLQALRSAERPGDPSIDSVCEAAGRAIGERLSPSLRPVINGTGVIIHTNLGRSPIGREVWNRAGDLVTRYSNLEYDLDNAIRGSRHAHIDVLAGEVFGCEAAILTNNNAGATLLLLATLASGKEVIVSRGELVEIGGSFRVPDVIQQGGARLREVGTTNRTRAADYRNALSDETAAILRVHRSNFEITGFTESPALGDLVELARGGVPLLYDEGSGRVVSLEKYGFGDEPSIREVLASGVDVVTCSTDKLIGATQGGLILGRREIIDRCRRHPLMRALRAGKESYGVICETLRIFAAGQHEKGIPIYQMLAASLESLRARAEALVAGTAAEVIEARSVLGGGTTPSESIASVGIRVAGDANEVAARFLRLDVPVVGRIQADSFTLDLRTVLEEEDELVRKALGG